jgi:hypothetical protein
MDTLFGDLPFHSPHDAPLTAPLHPRHRLTGHRIGANTTIFSAIDVFLLRPLPLTDADRLMQV